MSGPECCLGRGGAGRDSHRCYLFDEGAQSLGS